MALNAVARRSNWDVKLPDGVGRRIAIVSDLAAIVAFFQNLRVLMFILT